MTLSNGWAPQVPLSHLLRRRRDQVNIEDGISYKRVTIRLNGKGVSLRDEADGSRIGTKCQFKIRSNQFLLSKIDARNGAFGMVPEECDGAIITGNFWTFDAVPNSLDARYFNFLTQTRLFADFSIRASEGTTNRRYLQEGKFLQQTIPLPPLTEQRRIVGKIERLKGKTEEANKLRHMQQMESAALLRSLRRHAIASCPDSQWKPLGELVVDIENGWSPACHGFPANEGKWGVLKVGAVSFGTFDPRENKELPESLVAKPHLEIRPGDFLMSRANTTLLVGACAIADNPPPRLMLCDKIFRFRFLDDGPISPEYLDQVLKSPQLRDQIERAATGTSSTMKNISKAKILALRIPVPSVAQQRSIASAMRVTEAKLRDSENSFEHATKAINALLPSILDRAFRGEL